MNSALVMKFINAQDAADIVIYLKWIIARRFTHKMNILKWITKFWGDTVDFFKDFFYTLGEGWE